MKEQENVNTFLLLEPQWEAIGREYPQFSRIARHTLETVNFDLFYEHFDKNLQARGRHERFASNPVSYESVIRVHSNPIYVRASFVIQFHEERFRSRFDEESETFVSGFELMNIGQYSGAGTWLQKLSAQQIDHPFWGDHAYYAQKEIVIDALSLPHNWMFVKTHFEHGGAIDVETEQQSGTLHEIYKHRKLIRSYKK